MYLIYKIINNLFCLFWNKNKLIPLLKFRYFSFDQAIFNFDFTHQTTHLGDRLFFFPLIKSLHDKNIPYRITDNGLTEKLFYAIYGVCLLSSTGKNYINVVPKPSLLCFFKKYDNLILCDFTDLKVNNKVSLELISSFSLLFNINLDSNYSFDFNAKIPLRNEFLTDGDSYIIFNNYINSGFFRIFFLDMNLIIDKCILFKNSGFKIIHVGSLHDKRNDSNIYTFVDMDLRGLLSPDELISLLSNPNVFGIVTLDNFIMHIGHIFNKNTWVLFRGRFFKSHYLHHLNYINNNFSSVDKVNYL
jgi:hypothetical protein